MRCRYRAAVAVLCGLLVVLIGSPAVFATGQAGELVLQPDKGQAGDTYRLIANDVQCGGVYELEFEKSERVRLAAPDAEVLSWTRMVPKGAAPGPHTVNLYCVVDAESTLLVTAKFEVLSPLVGPVEVPDLTDLEDEEAQEALAYVGLTLGKVTGGEGKVVDQSPSPGTEVQPHTPVDVELDDQVTLVTVPNLVNQTVTQARALLRPLGLTLEGATTKGRIATQDPEPGVEVRPRTAVRVTIRAVPPTTQSPSRTTPTPPGTVAGESTTPPIEPARSGRALLLGASGSVVGLILLAAAVLIGRSAISTRERRWIRDHVHAVPRAGEADPPELDVDPRFPSTTIRLKPHQDAGTHQIEEERR